MHVYIQVDNVGNPSWQAQVIGSKRWILEPPSECYMECVSRIEVTVNSGDISKYLILELWLKLINGDNSISSVDQ